MGLRSFFLVIVNKSSYKSWTAKIEQTLNWKLIRWIVNGCYYYLFQFMSESSNKIQCWAFIIQSFLANPAWGNNAWEHMTTMFSPLIFIHRFLSTSRSELQILLFSKTPNPDFEHHFFRPGWLHCSYLSVDFVQAVVDQLHRVGIGEKLVV